MTTLTELIKERKVLSDRWSNLIREEHEAWMAWSRLEYGTEARKIAKAFQEAKEIERDQAQADYEAMIERMKLKSSEYERPTEGFVGLLSRPLGPLPDFTQTIDMTPENIGQVKSYRIAGVALLLAAVVLLITLTAFVPWLRISPAALISVVCYAIAGPVYGGLLTFLAWIALFLIGMNGVHFIRNKGKFLDAAAMYEEQWFRQGSESWSWPRRIYSCAAFGAVHIINVIYPLSSLIVVGIVGTVFMAAYLREYKRSSDQVLATIASAKLHAAYNRFAVAYMIIAITLSIAVSVFL